MTKDNVVFINANVLTLDEKNSKAGSIAVSNGRITGIWEESEPPSKLINPSTKLINLKGATVIPGFIDTHNHILMYALNSKKLNCSSPLNRSIGDILNLLKEKVKTTPEGTWIEGYGYDDTLLTEQRHPTRDELDSVAPNHPVFISHISAHLAVANSKAMKLAGLNEDTLDPPGGHFGRETHNGRLNGILYEFSAKEYVNKVIPIPTTEELATLIGESASDYLEKGITTNTDAGLGLFFGEQEVDAHFMASKKGLNPMRAQYMVMHQLLREGGLFGGFTANELNELIIKRTNGKGRLDSAKMFQDGSIQGLTGALRKPYYNQPEIKGDLIHGQDSFNEEILNLHNRGFRVAIHGNGDNAIGSIISAFEYALQESPQVDHRHRIEHLQTATTADLDKMKQLGIAGSVFINHIYYWGDRHKKLFLGPERAERMNPLADIQERNLLFTLHSDNPVTPIDLLFSVWAAVNRLTRDGEILGEKQRIDVITALKAMTIYGAKLNFTEDENGSIEVGKLADFAVLGEDPTAIESLAIKDIPILATIINGEVVYESKATLQSEYSR